MSESRKEERKKVVTFTPVYDLEENSLLGYLGDLTLIGALLVSEALIKTGRNITISIEFREASEIPADARMTIPARVVWCELEEHQTYYGAGLEFLEVTGQNKQVIEDALKKYQFSRKMPAK
jgi:c-di-GMP-binding flagellar brake protein YcgR